MRSLISGTLSYRIHEHSLSAMPMRSNHFLSYAFIFSFLISHFSAINADSTAVPRSSIRDDESGQPVSLFSSECDIHEHVLLNSFSSTPQTCICVAVASLSLHQRPFSVAFMTCESCCWPSEYDRLSFSVLVSGIHAVIILRDGDDLNSDANRTVLVRLIHFTRDISAWILWDFTHFHDFLAFSPNLLQFWQMLTFSSQFRILSEVSNSSCTKSQAAEFAFIMLPPLLGGAFCLLVSE